MKNQLEKVNVSKANRLIEARYKLSSSEQKLILLAISNLNSSDQKNFHIQAFNILDLARVLGLKDEKSAYKDIRELVRGLRKKEIIINTPDKELITGWLSSIIFEKNSGEMTLKFSEDLKPYLLELSGAYKSYQLENVIHMKSAYAIRIYEMLKQWEVKRKQTYTVEELKRRLALTDEYSRFTNFEKRVLEPAKAEINEHTDLWVTYRKVKKGRVVDSIEFEIEPKYGTVDVDAEEIKLYKALDVFDYDAVRAKCGLVDVKISDKQLAELYEIACSKTDSRPNADPHEYIQRNYYYTLSKNPKNVFSYLKKALDLDYAKVL